MKIILLTLLASTQAFAFDSANYTMITDGKYQIQVKVPTCPPRAMCGPVSKLLLSLPLKGCMDSAIVSYKLEHTTTKAKVIISAINVGNPASLTARCVVAPTAQKEITLGTGAFGKDSVEIEFLQTLAK